MADQEDWPDIYIDESVAPGGVGSQADPYSDFSEINWTTGGDNSIYDWYNNTPTASVTINLKKGEKWREQLTTGCSGSATYPIKIQYYGSGDDPIIAGGNDVLGVSGDWTDEGSNQWSRSLATECDVVVFNGTQVGTEDPAIDADYEWDWISSELWVYSVGNPTGYYSAIEAGQRSRCIYNLNYDYITIDGINCYGANDQGIYAINMSGFTVQYCTIRWTGDTVLHVVINSTESNITITQNTVQGTPGVNRNGIFVQEGASGTMTSVSITYNTISYCVQRGICLAGTSYTDRTSGHTISNNESSYCGDGCYLISVDSSTIANNHFHHNTDNSGGGELYGIGVLECDSNTFEYNELNNNSGEGMELSSGGGGSGCNGNVIRYCDIHNNARNGGIMISNAMGTGQNEIYYNLIYNQSGSGAAFFVRDPGHEIYNNVLYGNPRGLFIYSDDGDNIKFKNNIIANTGTRHVDVVSGITGFDCDYNLYDSDAGTLFRWAGTNYNFSGWKTASGQDGNSPTPASPQFVNPPTDFHLQSGSPARNAGTDVGLSQDYDGISVPQETYPAIGAYEFVGTINLFEDFTERLGKAIHQLHSGGHTLKIYLTNNTPDAAADAVKADLVGITEENGYAPVDIQNDYTESAGVGTLTGVDVTFTAQGGSFGPFRYAVLYNDTPTGPDDPLIGWYDYGSSITCYDTQTFKVDFGTKILDIG